MADGRLELPRLAAADFESAMSANSINRPYGVLCWIQTNDFHLRRMALYSPELRAHVRLDVSVLETHTLTPTSA